MGVHDYSTTAADNTSLNGITVSDASLANVVDNMVRQLMADIADQFKNGAYLAGGVVDSNGNELLDFSSVSSAVSHVEIGNAAGSDFPSVSAAGDGANVGLDIASKGESSIRFLTDSTDRGRVNSDGNFIIGRTTPLNSSRFTVQGAAGSAALAAYRPDAVSGQRLMSLHSDVGGTSTAVCVVAANGDMTNTNGSYGTISDERRKQDIAVAPSTWDEIKALRFITYKLKGGDEQLYGVSAQQTRETHPHLVSEDADGWLTFRSSHAFMRALGALQEAQARIEDLERRLAVMESAR